MSYMLKFATITWRNLCWFHNFFLWKLGALTPDLLIWTHKPPFFKYSLVKLHEIYSYAVCIKMFKARKANQFKPSHTINTRNRDQMQPVYLKLTMSQRAISFFGPKEWNRLPEDIRKTQNIGRFKKLLENHLLSLYREWTTNFYFRTV